MQDLTVKIASRNRLTIPQKVLDTLGGGRAFNLSLKNGKIVLQPQAALNKPKRKGINTSQLMASL